jgi:hypothetical protein
VDVLGNGVRTTTESAIGEKRLRRFEEILEHGYSWKRHYFERLFHAKCVIAMAQTIMGGDWAAKGVEVTKERGWGGDLSKFVCATAPRRFGKSVSVAKLIAAVAEVFMLMPEGLDFTTYPIAIFSTGKRASQALSAYVESFIQERHLDCYIIKNNSEEIVLQRTEAPSMTVTMKFLPSNPDRFVFFLRRGVPPFCFLFFVISHTVFKNGWRCSRFVKCYEAYRQDYSRCRCTSGTRKIWIMGL